VYFSVASNIVVILFFAQLMQSWIFHPFFHIDLTFRQCSVITSLSRTCDITHLDKKTRLISLESEDSTNVRYIIRKFNELKEIIVSKIARADVVFLEVPSISIQHWNYSLSMYLPLLTAKMTAFRIARRFSTSIGLI
jgi:hypothetical protein